MKEKYFLILKNNINFIFNKLINIFNYNKILYKESKYKDKETQTDLTLENLENLLKLENEIKTINTDPENYKWIII